MDGELVEKGSHQELIQAKGKYQDLWSKQTFITPSCIGRSRYQNPKKDGRNIINDLSPAEHTAELANAMNKVAGLQLPNASTHSKKESQKCEHATSCRSCHKCEVCQFKP